MFRKHFQRYAVGFLLEFAGEKQFRNFFYEFAPYLYGFIFGKQLIPPLFFFVQRRVKRLAAFKDEPSLFDYIHGFFSGIDRRDKTYGFVRKSYIHMDVGIGLFKVGFS